MLACARDIAGRPTVKTAANLCMQINYNNKDMLMAGMVRPEERKSGTRGSGGGGC